MIKNHSAPCSNLVALPLGFAPGARRARQSRGAKHGATRTPEGTDGAKRRGAHKKNKYGSILK